MSSVDIDTISCFSHMVTHHLSSGVRLGTPALTSRSFKEADFTKVAALLHRTVQLALKAQQVAGSKLMKDFVAVLAENAEIKAELGALKTEVHALAKAFPMPGVVV